MVSLASVSNDSRVLEPSSGKGVFIDSLIKAGFLDIEAYEVDSSLSENKDRYINYQSFVSTEFSRKFNLVIGNPPYVRWKNLSKAQKDELAHNLLWTKYFNGLSDYLYIFILKSVELLREGGELIFITPEYWLSTMHAESLRNYLLENGCISEIYQFKETPIFDNVASSVIVFKFIKNRKCGNKRISVYMYDSKKRLSATDLVDVTNNKSWTSFNISQFRANEAWLLAPDNIKDELRTYEESCQTKTGFSVNSDSSYIQLGDIADIANGLVSGLDKAFKLPLEASLNLKEEQATLNVIKAKDVSSFNKLGITKYIYLNEKDVSEESLAKDYPFFFNQLSQYKKLLIARYNYNRPINYWDWVLLRSINLFKKNTRKIFVPCKERITNKSRLRFCLAEANEFPTQDITAIYLNPKVKENVYYILALLNSKITYDWVRYKGLIKGGVAEFSEKPLSIIPIKLINWDNNNEVVLYKKIVGLAKSATLQKSNLEAIDKLVYDLLDIKFKT